LCYGFERRKSGSVYDDRSCRFLTKEERSESAETDFLSDRFIKRKFSLSAFGKGRRIC
jgi:hypothetical protein